MKWDPVFIEKEDHKMDSGVETIPTQEDDPTQQRENQSRKNTYIESWAFLYNKLSNIPRNEAHVVSCAIIRIVV